MKVVSLSVLWSLLLMVFRIDSADSAQITPPPAAFFDLVPSKHQSRARAFYHKYLDVGGMPVVASGDVADRALERTQEIVLHLLAGRPDLLHAMVTNGMYLIIIGKDQVYTDMPEYSDHPNPAYQNERVRGTGGKPTSFGEENLLSLPLDRYDDESIAVHEFCHTIDGTLRSLDPAWADRRSAVYRHALDKGLWKNTYAASNPGEFWAEIAQSYFDCNRINNWNHGPIGTRAQLKEYDSESYELVHAIFNLKPEQDWRYAWVQKLPNVIPPPPKFKIDPYYTRFTWAREFTVVGRNARDESLLKANDTIRKMFAYRHDTLKTMINDGIKLVVLGRGEKLTDLPELRNVPDPKARTHNYSPETKLLVVDEENIADLLRLFGKAIYEVTGKRPVDPNWENRGRDVQQYELRVKRLDIAFDQKLRELFKEAQGRGLWPGTSHPADYWANGFAAYFDSGGSRVETRDKLKEYDPALFGLVNTTMAYEGHVDWRYRP